MKNMDIKVVIKRGNFGIGTEISHLLHLLQEGFLQEKAVGYFLYSTKG